MENDRHPGHRPPILDMTPEGEFREPAPSRRNWLDRALARIGGVALLVTLAAGGLLLVALAVLFLGLLLPVVIGAGLIGFVSLWWRARRLRGQGGAQGGPGGIRFMVIRR
jgi:hypothetical protein